MSKLPKAAITAFIVSMLGTLVLSYLLWLGLLPGIEWLKGTRLDPVVFKAHTTHNVFMAFAALVGPTTIALLALLPLGVALGQPAATGWSAAALLFQLAVATVTVVLLESRVRRMMRRRGELVTPVPAATFWKLPFAILLAQLVVCYAILASRFLRRMSWRGVTYQIDGPFNVRLIADEQREVVRQT